MDDELTQAIKQRLINTSDQHRREMAAEGHDINTIDASFHIIWREGQILVTVDDKPVSLPKPRSVKTH
jgi:hypothetical protein